MQKKSHCCCLSPSPVKEVTLNSHYTGMGIEVSAAASSLRTPKVQPKVAVPHQNKSCAKGLSVVIFPRQTWGAE